MLLLFIYLISFIASIFCSENPSSYFIAIKKNNYLVWENLEDFIELVPPEGKYYADPFIYKHGELNYLFFEDYDYAKGIISYVTIDKQFNISKPAVALNLPTHLSFPFVFEDKGQIYMMPETYADRCVSLYKASEFPNKWNHYKTVVKGYYFSDPILFKYNGYYWLFTSTYKDKLLIYYAKDLESDFLPHPVNQQHRKGRNAGPIFYWNNQMIRPNMNCTIKYGHSMTLKEIQKLTTSVFIEKSIYHIKPNWAPDLIGTHSYCQGEDYVVFDGEKANEPSN